MVGSFLYLAVARKASSVRYLGGLGSRTGNRTQVQQSGRMRGEAGQDHRAPSMILIKVAFPSFSSYSRSYAAQTAAS